MAEEPPKLEERLKKLLVERLYLKTAPENIKDEDKLMKTLGIDSVQIFEMVIGIEEELGIEFGEDEFDLTYFESIKSLADYLRDKKGVKY